jgi:hypothetical protein
MTDTKAIEIIIAREAVRSEYGSRLCDWTGTRRTCPVDPSPRCRCDDVGRAVIAALDASRTPPADLVERARQAADEIAALDKTLPWGDRMEFIILAALTAAPPPPADAPMVCSHGQQKGPADER